MRIGAKFFDETSFVVNGSFDVLQHIFLRFFLHVDGAPMRQKRKTVLHLIHYALVRSHKKAAETAGKIIFLIKLCNEIEYRQLLFARIKSKTTAKLLQEYGQRFRWAKE